MERIEEQTLLAGGLLSAASSTCLIVCCAISLKARGGKSLVAWQLLQLAVADLVLAIWQSVIHGSQISGHGIMSNSLVSCSNYSFIDRFLLMLSILYSLTFALAMVFQILHLQTPRIMWHSWWLAIPLAAVMEIAFLLDLSVNADPDFAWHCNIVGVGVTIYTAQVIFIFSVMVALHIIVLRRCWSQHPRSVASRSARHAARYLCAFFCTHVLRSALIIWLWFDETAADKLSFRGFLIAAEFFEFTNGFFNTLAFVMHLVNLRQKNRTTMVGFVRDDNLNEVLAVPAQSADRGNVTATHQSSHQEEVGEAFTGIFAVPKPVDVVSNRTSEPSVEEGRSSSGHSTSEMISG